MCPQATGILAHGLGLERAIAEGARLGQYNEPCFLQDKAALSLYEFHADDYKGLRLCNSKTNKQRGFSQAIEDTLCIYP
jgi:hypothetical protein